MWIKRTLKLLFKGLVFCIALIVILVLVVAATIFKKTQISNRTISNDSESPQTTTTPTPIGCSNGDELSESMDLSDSLKLVKGNEAAEEIVKANCIAVIGKLEAKLEGNETTNFVFWGSGIGCGSCHNQVIYVLSDHHVVFKEDIDDPKVEIVKDEMGQEMLSIMQPLRRHDEGYCCPTNGLKTIYRWSDETLLPYDNLPFKY